MRLFWAARRALDGAPAMRPLCSRNMGARRTLSHRPGDVTTADIHSPMPTGQPSSTSSSSKGSNDTWNLLSAAFTRFDRRFEVFEVGKRGALKRTSVTLGEVLRDFGVHPRDVLSLGLQDERYHPPPAVLPRDGVVVIALGPFKALVHTEACLLFEAGKVDVTYIAPLLAGLMQANSEEPPAEEERGAAPDTRVGVAGGERLIGGGGANLDVGVDAGSSTSTPATTPPAEGVRELGQKGPLSPGLGNDAGASSPPPSPPPPTAGARGASTTGGEFRGVSAGVKGGGTAANTPVAARVDRETGLSPDIVSRLGEYVSAFGFGRGVGEDGEAGAELEEEVVAVPEDHQMKVMFREQRPMPFELAMLEAMLQEVCTSYHRRSHVIRRLMDQRLKPNATTSLFTPNRAEHYRVVPLKLALKQLELKLSQTRACLEDLMHSDEDMLGLLLTETKELGKGESLDPVRHSVVELMLENYHRQLVLVGHDVAAMKQEMESVQELAAISLDVSRNSMIAVDIRLAMLNLGVASSACVFGAMGMNVVNGLETSSLAFYGLLGGSAAASAAALGSVMRHLRSVARAGDSQQGELMALNTICDHVDDIESVLRIELDSRRGVSGRGYGSVERGEKTRGGAGSGVIDRDAMARKLSRARGKEISKEELDLIFSVFDTTGDGSIDTLEYGKLIPEPAGSRGNKGGGGGPQGWP